MRENRTYGSEGGEPVMDNSPTPISVGSDLLKKSVFPEPFPLALRTHYGINTDSIRT